MPGGAPGGIFQLLLEGGGLVPGGGGTGPCPPGGGPCPPGGGPPHEDH